MRTFVILFLMLLGQVFHWEQSGIASPGSVLLLMAACGWAVAREMELSKLLIKAAYDCRKKRRDLPTREITWDEFTAEPEAWFREADAVELIVERGDHVMSIVRRPRALEA